MDKTYCLKWIKRGFWTKEAVCRTVVIIIVMLYSVYMYVDRHASQQAKPNMYSKGRNLDFGDQSVNGGQIDPGGDQPAFQCC